MLPSSRLKKRSPSFTSSPSSSTTTRLRRFSWNIQASTAASAMPAKQPKELLLAKVPDIRQRSLVYSPCFFSRLPT